MTRYFLSIALVVVLLSPASAGALNIQLTVEGCNNNNACEPYLGESVSSCSADCTAFQCGDGVDNDGDGDIDYPDDLQCTDKNDDSEDTSFACSDGIDNDGDGDIDYPADPGCTSAQDDDESDGGGSSGGGGGSGPGGDDDDDDGVCPDGFICTLIGDDDDDDDDDGEIGDDDDDDDGAPGDDDDDDGGPAGPPEVEIAPFEPQELTLLSPVIALSGGIEAFLDNVVNRTVVQAIALASLITSAVSTFLSLAFVNPISLSEFVLLPVRLWSLLMSAFGLRRKRRPWGTVYDSITKQPLDPAYVILEDLSGNEVDTSITDLDGRYGFLVEPGQYRLRAQKTHYSFPSERLSGNRKDELYDDLYFGSVISIQEEGEVVTRNIPMDPDDFDWNEFTKREQKLMKYYRKRDVLIARITNIFFVIGFSLTAIITFFYPTVYNIVILGLYVLFSILKETKLLKRRAYGFVEESETGQPLPYAILRVYHVATGKEMKKVVANERGRYFCLINNGTYYVTLEKKLDDGSYTVVHTSEEMTVQNGVINKQFVV